jgi:hypothetical protein
VPLALVLDGDVTIFTFTTMVELGPEIGHSNAGHRHTWHHWRIGADGARVLDGSRAAVSVRECTTDDCLHPP